MSRKALGAGGRWLQSWQSGITDPASGPVRAETWPEGREKGDGAAAFGALPQLLSPGVQAAHQGWRHWGGIQVPQRVGVPCLPCSRVLGHQEGPRAPARSCRATFSLPSWDRVGLHSQLAVGSVHQQHGQHPEPWDGERRACPTLQCQPQSHGSLTSTVFCVCTVRGWGWPGAQSTAAPEAVL